MIPVEIHQQLLLEMLKLIQILLLNIVDISKLTLSWTVLDSLGQNGLSQADLANTQMFPAMYLGKSTGLGNPRGCGYG